MAFPWNSVGDLALGVGEHWFWKIGHLSVHGQVLVMSWLVFAQLIFASVYGNRNLSTDLPVGWQNLTEFVTEYIRDLTKAQVGEQHAQEWIPFVGTIFLFVFVSNWTGALLPWKVLELPEGELAAPTNDINTTAALALLTSFSYFYAGLKQKGLGYFKRVRRFAYQGKFIIPK